MFDEDTPIFRAVSEWQDTNRYPVRTAAEPLGLHRWTPEPTTGPIPIVRGDAVTDPAPATPEDPVAVTAGEENHEDPWAFAGDDAAAPESSSDDLAQWGGA